MRIWRLLAVLAAVAGLVVALTVARPHTSGAGDAVTNAAQAAAAATAWFKRPETHGAGSTVSNVAVENVELRAAGTVWRVTIHGDVTEQGHSGPGISYGSAMILDVAGDGTITIVAQG